MQLDIEPVSNILADPDRIEQIVNNLVTNAIKFTPNGRLVTVTLQQADSAIELSVGDTGIGIPEEFIPRLFEPFSQGDSGTKQDGLGLGLSIVENLVNAHKATIAVASPGHGCGTTFTVSFPFGPAPPALLKSTEGGGVAGTQIISQSRRRRLIHHHLGAQPLSLRPRPEYIRLFKAIVLDVWRIECEQASQLVQQLRTRVSMLQADLRKVDDAFALRRSMDPTRTPKCGHRLSEQIAFAALEANEAQIHHTDVEGVLALAEHVLSNASALWVSAPVEQQPFRLLCFRRELLGTVNDLELH